MEIVREIPITDLKGLRIGNAQNEEAKTGVTVLLFDHGARMGVDISGPASRETPLASPITADNPVHALVLSGGSAFGLAAGDGVMRYLEERGIGYETGFAKIPLVCQSCIYDLGCGRADIRPDAQMGYRACADAEQNHPACGSIGGGTGATVGKLYGMERSMKSGIGICAASVGALQMAAVVVVNALGDIYDPKNGKKIAGLRGADGTGFADTCRELYQISQRTDLFRSNTTIGAVVTNGNAYARCIRPVGTMADGDTIYGASIGDMEADINVAGTLAAEVMAEAVCRAVTA